MTNVAVDSSKEQGNGATTDQRGILGEKGKNNFKKTLSTSWNKSITENIIRIDDFGNFMIGSAIKSRYILNYKSYLSVWPCNNTNHACW